MAGSLLCCSDIGYGRAVSRPPAALTSPASTSPDLMRPTESQPFDSHEFEALVREPALHANVGPGTPWPAVITHLGDSDPSLDAAVQTLPCPVIGVGEGSLQNACDVVVQGVNDAAPLFDNVRAAPLAAMVLVQQLRLSERLSVRAALTAESLAYATLQAGLEFRLWRDAQSRRVHTNCSDERQLLVERRDNWLYLRLNRPAQRNAIGVTLRDALCAALDVPLSDTTIRHVHLEGNGPCFCAGGDLEEFGIAPDAATAHWIRTQRLPSARLAQLGERLSCRVHGASVGAGIELAAFAGQLRATPDAWFQLPELRYGLIPGAGGTVSLPRRIGRQRTAYLALSMTRLDARRALDWGLIDAVES